MRQRKVTDEETNLGSRVLDDFLLYQVRLVADQQLVDVLRSVAVDLTYVAKKG